MSSYLIEKIESNINLINEIADKILLDQICEIILSKKDKNLVLFLIQNGKISKSMSLHLFQFIVNNKFWNLFLELDYKKFDIHAGDDYAFVESVKSGYFNVVNFLIENGANIHTRDKLVLKWSLINEENKLIDLLIEKGANLDIDYTDAFKMVIHKGDINMIKFLIEKGSDIHACDDYAIRLSSENGHIEVVKFLIENGANIHALNDYALSISSGNGHIEVVKILVENGANIHANDDYALRMSSRNGHVEVVKFLIENGAIIDANDGYALIWSSYNGHIEVVKFLVENGANIHTNDDEALLYSDKNGHIEIVKYLIQSDIEYFRDNKYIKCYVRSHILDEIFGVIIPKTKNEIICHIKNQNIELIKKYDEFDFSVDDYYCFFKALETDNIKLIQIIFDKLQNKDDLLNIYNKISFILDDNTKNKVNHLYKNDKLEKIKSQLNDLLIELNQLEN